MSKKKQNQDQKNKNIDEKELENQIQELANLIDTLEDEKLDITNQLKRALADYQNLEKNTEKLTRLRFLQTKKHLAEDLIPIIDSLTIALKSREDLRLDEKAESWVEGITASISNLEKVLNGMGLTKFVPEKGEKFDSDIHEAVTTVEEGKEGHIFDVIQPGYNLDGVIIRPARVVVSK
jgi:molecular chaperone GrpE